VGAQPQTASAAFAASATRALPRDIAAFTGRQAEVARLMAMLTATGASDGAVGIRAINGMAGVGKTALAVHAAHLLADGSLMDSFSSPYTLIRPGRDR
jgi:Holliday junction resolvasome RuvABC ATP-dependent DNA helicase subunit